MLDRRKDLLLESLVKLQVTAYILVCTTEPSKKLPFQTMMSPPEAPAEGKKANLSRLLG